jgi:hypothetical protein
LCKIASRMSGSKRAREKDIDPIAFEKFLLTQKKALQRIARATRGECELADVQSEAWLLAQRLPQAKGWTVDFADAGQQDRFLSYLYQELVRYTELVVRQAVRLDHSPGGDAAESHPLLNMLVAEEGRDPLAALLIAEAGQLQAAEPNVHHSLASAYLWLLRRLDNNVRSVAQHLLISLSHCYRRLAQARKLAQCQQVLPPTLTDPNGDFMPKPWRKERVFRIPIQLTFDFDCEPLLWIS